jgi:hypothetical protein
VWRRWHARMRGAIMPCLNFFVSFFFQEKKERQPLAVSKHTCNTLEAYSTKNNIRSKSNLFK